MTYYLDWTIERDETAFDITVEYSYRRGAPQTWTDPADPDEVELLAVLYGGEPFLTTEDEDAKIADYIYDNPPDDDYPEYD